MNFLVIIFFSYTLKGYVKDADTKAPLPFVYVKIQELKISLLTDSLGEFLVSDIKPGEYHLKFLFTGYKTKELKLLIEKDTTISILLSSQEFLIEEMTVTPGEYSIRSEEIIPGEAVLTQKDIIKTPGTAADLFWALQDLPGVQGMGDNAVIAIQGGNPDEVGVWIEGLIMPHPYHLETVEAVSFVDESIVDNVSLYQAGYPVDLGNKLSGALDINLKTGVEEENFYGMADLSMASAHLLVGKKNLLLSFNRSYLDLLAKVFQLGTADFTAYPSYWDFQSVISFPFLKGNIKTFFIAGKDGYSVDLKEDYGFIGEYKNKSEKGLFGASFSKEIGNTGYRIALGGSLFRMEENIGEPYYWNVFERGIHLRADFFHKFFSNFILYTGIEEIFQNVNLWMVIPEDSFNWRYEGAPKDTVERNRLNLLSGGFLKLRYALQEKIIFESGIRTDYMKENKEWIFDPRAGISFYPFNDITLRFGIGLYHQFPKLYQLDKEYGNPELKSSNSFHSAFSLEKKIKNEYLIEGEIFYKKYRNLPLRSPTKNFVSDGKGWSNGFQILLKRFENQAGGNRGFGWVSYTFTNSKREIIEGEGYVPADYDITHILTVVLSLKLPKNFEIGIKSRYATGRPYTPVDSVINTGEFPIPIYAKTNSDRLPAYQRTDLRITHERKFSNLTFISYIEFLNLFNRKNVIHYLYNVDYSEKKPIFLFGRLIVGGFVLEF